MLCRLCQARDALYGYTQFINERPKDKAGVYDPPANSESLLATFHSKDLRNVKGIAFTRSSKLL